MTGSRKDPARAGRSILDRVIYPFIWLFGLFIHAVVDAEWFRAMCRPLITRTQFQRDRTVMVDGNIMHARRVDQYALLLLYRYQVNEHFEKKLLQAAARPGMTAIDVGANLGYFTVALAEAVTRSGRVYAFEPDPACFAVLGKTIAANDLEQVVAEQAAVADQPGICRLYLCLENAGDNRIYDLGDHRPSVEVAQLSLDDRFPDMPVGLIKMDIQGAELLVVRGMKNLLARNHDVLVLSEFSPPRIRECGGDPQEMLDTMTDLGFTAYLIDSRAETLRTVTHEDLFGRLSFMKDINLLFARQLPAALRAFAA